MANDESRSTGNASNPQAPSSQPPSPSLGQSVCEFESFEYHDDESAFRAIFSHDVESPSCAVVSAVSAVSNTDPLDMDPLHATVDTDALESLIGPRRAAVGDVHITFEYHGYEVTVSSYGSIKIKPVQACTSSPVEDD